MYVCRGVRAKARLNSLWLDSKLGANRTNKYLRCLTLNTQGDGPTSDVNLHLDAVLLFFSFLASLSAGLGSSSLHVTQHMVSVTNATSTVCSSVFLNRPRRFPGSDRRNVSPVGGETCLGKVPSDRNERLPHGAQDSQPPVLAITGSAFPLALLPSYPRHQQLQEEKEKKEFIDRNSNPKVL